MIRPKRLVVAGQQDADAAQENPRDYAENSLK